MSIEINLKELWERQESTIPAEKEIFAKAEKLKQDIRNKSLILILVLSATIAAIFFVWFNAERQMVTSSIGLTMVIFAISLGIVNFIKAAISSTKVNETTDTNTYIQNMLQIKEQQELTQTKLLTSYFTFLSVGLAFYLYEPTIYMDVTTKTVVYIMTFGWIAFSWFYLRPKTIRKQRAKINSIIEKLQSINKNLTERE